MREFTSRGKTPVRACSPRERTLIKFVLWLIRHLEIRLIGAAIRGNLQHDGHKTAFGRKAAEKACLTPASGHQTKTDSGVNEPLREFPPSSRGRSQSGLTSANVCRSGRLNPSRNAGDEITPGRDNEMGGLLP